MGEKIALTKEKETLLLTLYGKGEESRLPDSLLHDRFAADAINKIDYDFSKLKMNRDMAIGVAMRAGILDGWVRDFIARFPHSTVLNLGCGLDSRVFRIDPPSGVRWFDIDYPDVIDLRWRVFPERENYTPIGSTVTAPNLLDAIPADRPVLIVAEGLLPYLPADAVSPLLNRITTHFPSGEMIFDAYSKLGIWFLNRHPSIRATGASLHWSLDDPHQLEIQNPKMKLLDCFIAYDPKAYDPAQIARMSFAARLSIRIIRLIPPLVKIGRLLRYRF